MPDRFLISTASGDKRISIPLEDADHLELAELARRTRTSVASLGHLAISRMLIQARSGLIPLLPEEPAEEPTGSHR